jgi:sentrin-specific protease 8
MSPVFLSGKMQRHEKIAALKPVASRPFSSFRSFPKLLQDFTSTGSPPITVLEEAVLVKPKATRFPSLPSELPTEITATIVSLTLEFSSDFSAFF